jgi:hypothetical protein
MRRAEVESRIQFPAWLLGARCFFPGQAWTFARSKYALPVSLTGTAASDMPRLLSPSIEVQRV